MLIKSLKMENFRQFKGITAVDFSCDPEKNVTIILGDNTFGKTTLLQAFNWCFYGKATFNQNPDFLLNYEVAAEMMPKDTRNVEVEITLIHDNTEYIISRIQKYTFYGDSVKGDQYPVVKVSYKQSDGQMESVRAVQVTNVINNILPEELSSYFFFDTERVNSISTRKDVADAVKGLLGLSTIDSAIKHLGKRSAKTTVIGTLYGDMDMDGDAKAQEALNRIQTAEEKRNIIAEQFEENDSQIKNYEGRKEQLEDILRDNQTTAKLQNEKEEKESIIKEDQKTLEDTRIAYFKEFGYGSLAFFAQPLINKTKALLKEVKVDDKGVRDLTKPTIMELVKRGKCICGADILEGNDAYNHLMAELAYVPPESIGNTVRHYREKVNSFSKPANRTFESLTERYQLILRLKNRIQEREDEISEISEQIKGKDNMHQYEVELNDIKKRIKQLNDRKIQFIKDDTSQKNDIERYRKIYDSLLAVSGKNKLAMQLIEYAEHIYERLTQAYKDKEIIIREELEKKVNEIFERMYHGHRRVAIDQKYHVSLLTTIADKEIAAGESEGSNRVKNFAFIAGLVALAKEKIINDGLTDEFEEELDLASEPYPLVMDAPFSNADETHTANISKVLPEIADQVIMFVMQKDWNYARPVMSNRVGRQYQLNKLSETHTKLE
ncbi:MAG: AAA family ATPase [Ruminococcaceae bacterium]|nr:AAA family ATPase [Oscillospiraceae bacterium]